MRTFLILLLLLIPNWSQAGEFYMEVSDDSSSVGEPTRVVLFVNTTENANVVSGQLSFDTSAFAVSKITVGGSIVSFWIEKPSEREDGLISFSGLVAGGFTATQAQLFAVELIPQKVGESMLSLKNVSLLAHDGLGSALPVTTQSLMIKVNEDSFVLNDSAKDTESPESFTPVVIQKDDWFDGKAVLVFDTTDKDSGIDAYYVKEVWYEFFAPFVSWRLVNSPYVIKDQTLRSYIYIKAEDKAGNSEVVEVVSKNGRSVSPFILVFLVLFLVIVVLKRKRRHA